MRQFTKANTIDIRLNEEKFYFPGQTIEGNVLLHLHKSAKTNHIRITFSGDVQIAIKDKETINLFQKTEILPVSPNSNGKAQVLEAKQHTFPFTFIVPENLPSSLELGKRKAHIRYKLTAIHDRPMVPETLSAKADYDVQILEFIDVESPEYNQPQDEILDFTLPAGRQQCQLKVSIPRLGYTRGDLVKLKVLLTHYERFVQEKAIRIDLIRAVNIRTARNTLGKEDILKSITHNANIIGPYNFTQDFNSQLPIPTSTPPSIRYKNEVIDIHYKVRIQVSMSQSKKSEWQHQLELPIVVGTWPKASVPIDDDDDEMDGPIGLSDDDDDDEDDEDDQHSVVSVPPLKMASSRSSTTILQQQQHQHQQHRQHLSASRRSNPTASAVNMSALQHPQQNGGVVRSDSNASRSSQKSRNSQASWRSSQSWEPHASPTLSRNTSASTTIPHPEAPLRSSNPGNANPNGGIAQQSYFNRSSSTPDLLAHQQQYYHPYSEQQQYYQNYQQQQQQQPSHPSSGPYYPPMLAHVPQPLTQNNNINNTNNYQGRTTFITTGNVPAGMYRQQQYTPPTPTSSRMPMPSRNYPYADELNEQQQQQPPYPYPPLQQQQQYRVPQETVSSDDSDDSEDDGDLLRIIEKKKKREKRAAQTAAAAAAGNNTMYKY